MTKPTIEEAQEFLKELKALGIKHKIILFRDCDEIILSKKDISRCRKVNYECGDAEDYIYLRLFWEEK